MTAPQLGRRAFLQGTAALGLIAVMPRQVRTALAVPGRANLAAPIAIGESVVDRVSLRGWSIAFDDSMRPTDERQQVSLYRGEVCLERQAIASRQPSLQVWYPPGMGPYGRVDEFRMGLSRSTPCFAVLYTSNGVAVLRSSG